MLYDKSKVPIKGVKQMYEDAVQFLTNRYSGLTGSEKQLADYLNVDRSALSKELGKMRDEGILTTRKNAFTLY